MTTIGHNLPTLIEQLKNESVDMTVRVRELCAAAERAHVNDDDTAGRATALAKMINECGKRIEDARKDRKQPFLDDGRTVDAFFASIAYPIKAASKRVVGLIDVYRRAEERKTEEQRRQFEAEAAAQRKIAEAEMAMVSEATSLDSSIESEISADLATQAADIAAAKAAALVAGPIDSGLGAKASGRIVWSGKITDVKKAISHCMKIDQASLVAAVQAILDRQVRAGIREFPGAEITSTTTTIIR